MRSNFAAFEADTPFGRFSVYVLFDALMHEWEARQDAFSVIRSEFGASARLLGHVVRVSGLPSDAFASRHAPGWGWLSRGALQASLGEAA